MYKTSFYVYTVKCGEQLMHSEIIKVVHHKEDKLIEGQRRSISFRLRIALFNILYARDSMSFYSSVRPIRERIEKTKMKLTVCLLPLNSVNPEEDFKQQNETRDKQLGYLLHEIIHI